MTSFVERPDGARLAWDARGDGPAVLLVHGIGYTRATWQPQVDSLVAAGYRAVRFDLRGFGESTLPAGRSGLDELLGDLDAVVDRLDLAPVRLVAHSMGAMIAQRWAVGSPDALRALALVATTSHNGRRASAFARLMATFAEHGFDEVLANAELRGEAERILAEAFPAGVELRMLRRGLEAPSRARAMAWRACIDFSEKDRIGTIRCPVLVAHGTADRLIPFVAGELVHRAIPGSVFHVEEGAGHALPRERATSFDPVLLALLARAG